MSLEMLVTSAGDEVRIIIARDNDPVDLIVERSSQQSQVGNIYLGRVETVSQGINAAFVDIGRRKSGFLPLRDNVSVTEGQSLLVQVTRDAFADKGPQLTAAPSVPGRYLVYSPNADSMKVSRQIEDEGERDRLIEIMSGIAQETEGLIARTVSEGANADVLETEIGELRSIWLDIEATRDQTDAPALVYQELPPAVRAIRDNVADETDAIIFNDAGIHAAAEKWCARFVPHLAENLALHRGEMGLFDERGLGEIFDTAIDRKVGLPSGGGLVIETTEALTVIDVNSGRYLGGGSPEENALTTNLEAVVEIARQIRLRNIGGMTIIDFIRMEEDESWERLLADLGEALANDRVATRLAGRTEAGLVEIIRRRTRQPLAEILLEDCYTCDGDGQIKRVETVLFELIEALRATAAAGPPGELMIEAAPDIIEALERIYRDGEGAAGALRIGRGIEWREEPELTDGSYEVTVV